MAPKWIIVMVLVYIFAWADAQAGTPSVKDGCTGVYLSYQSGGVTKIYPFTENKEEQAYSFNSTVTVLNTGKEEIQGWQVFVGFQHGEVLVSVTNAVIEDGSSLPANVSNGTVLSGFPQTNLKTAIDTAGDLTQMQAQIQLSGTEFGADTLPMPTKINLTSDEYICDKPTTANGSMELCCSKDPTYKPKITEDTRFLPSLEGDLTMTYDVTSAYESNYLALVTISNNNPIGRLDNWNLTWEWERGEFIYEMKGAQTLEQDLNACFNGPAGSFYQDPKFDFTQVMNCQKKPTIVDLPPQLANDTLKGKIEHCCRNGILLPSVMDSTKSKAAFQLQVFKLPPDLNRTTVYPPLNWKIRGVLNPDYQCGQPRRVSPTQFPDPYGTSRVTSAIASWQVVCNITTNIGSPHCCVSFSAYYNESVVPCRTCACGCPSSIKPSCNRDKDALLLPSNALLIPFENRTMKALAWAGIQHFPVSPPLPCADYCGVSINWHVYGDYRKGWSARITLFNWDNYTFADWFTAIELPQAFPGYQDVYSFNGTTVPGLNNTIFMQGKPGLNYLEAEKNGTNPAVDYMVPGKQQSMISFTKKQTPGINIVAGEGFPTKVIFNGEECSLPHAFPIAAGHSVSVSMPTLLVSFMFLFLFEKFW